MIKYTLAELMREGVRPGDLRFQVAVEKEGYSKTPSGLNDDVSPTVTKATVWAGKHDNLSAKEIEYFGLMTAERPTVWVLRYPQDFVVADKSIIVYGSELHRVTGMPKEDDRKQFIFVPTTYLSGDDK